MIKLCHQSSLDLFTVHCGCVIKVTEANKLSSLLVLFFSIAVHHITILNLIAALLTSAGREVEKVTLVLGHYAKQTECCDWQNWKLACSCGDASRDM